MAMDYTDIDQVVNDFQLMMDDTSYDKEAQIYQLRLLAMQGLRELKFDVEQSVKTITGIVNSTTLKMGLPSDYVKLLRVGYKNDDEEIVSLGYKSNLTLNSSMSSGVGSSSYDENNPYYHTDIGKKFGVGGGQNTLGYYRLNRNDNTINFSSDLAGKTVFMEYMSDGTNIIENSRPTDHIIKLTFNNYNGVKGSDSPLSTLFYIPHPTSNNEFIARKDYKFIGGFLRYDIDHYNDTEKKEDATPKKEIETFIKSILFIN